MKQSFRTKLKQWWVPAEFRLPEPEFTREQLDLLEELIQLIAPNISRAASATKDGSMQIASFLVDLGTGIWRIRRKIESLSRMPREIRDALYSLESMWNSMSEGGVEIVDHIGTIPSAREAKIVETLEVQGLAREQVVDAVKPTIFLRGEVVQLGEVIMGKPVSSANTPEISKPEPVLPVEREDVVAEEHGAEEIQPPAVEVETFTMEPPLKKWEPQKSQELVEASPIETESSVEAIEDITDGVSSEKPESEEVTISEEQVLGIVPIHDEGEQRLDSETAVEIEAMESPAGTEPAIPETVEERTGTDEPELEIPLPRKAPRRSKSIREAVKQVIQEEPEALAFDDMGRAKRRKKRSEAAKQEQDIPAREPEAQPEPAPEPKLRKKRASAAKKEPETQSETAPELAPKPRKKRVSKKTEEGGA